MLTEEILVSLEKVKSTGANKWLACCPAHDDVTPSMSVTDAGDKTLVKCWSGCSTYDIVNAMGLTMGDFFHYKMTDTMRTEKRDFHSREKLKHLALIVWMAYHYKKNGILKDSDRDIANNAYKTLRKAGWL